MNQDAAALYAVVLRELHTRFKPHEGQIDVGSALFNDDIRSIFVQCGRKWGKTELGMYFLWRWAMTFPGLGCFYVAPELKQGKKIVWEDPRMLNFGPRSWVTDINQSETRIRLINGSYLKLDGSDNYEAHRGTRPGIIIYEEYKDHDPRFRNVMRPNLAVFNAPEIFLGTPPDRECEFTATADEHKNAKGKLFYQAPTWQNPGVDKQWLWDEKRRLYLRGEGDTWEREYAAKFVPGGSQKIFPMFGRSFVKPHDEMMSLIKKKMKKLMWCWWADPASTSCFAVLFVAIDPFTKTIYVLDEIYEQDQSLMTVKKIGQRALEKREELWDRKWRQGYDEQASWFAKEFYDHFEESLEPSHKHLHDKTEGLTLMKDIMLQARLLVSDRCPKFFWEIDNYFKDKNGNIPKKNDHLIDTFRYILGAHNYQLEETKEYREEDDENFRSVRMLDEIGPRQPNHGDYREI